MSVCNELIVWDFFPPSESSQVFQIVFILIILSLTYKLLLDFMAAWFIWLEAIEPTCYVFRACFVAFMTAST